MHAGVVYNDSLIIYGGEISNYSFSNELWMFSMLNNEWVLLSHDLNIPPLAGHTLTIVETSIYLIGGM